MTGQTQQANGLQASPVHVSQGGKNAILFILTMDLVKGYDQVTEWLEANPGFVLNSVAAQAVQLATSTHIMGAPPPQGFGITAICSRVFDQSGYFDTKVFIARMEENLSYIKDCLADYIQGDETGGIAAIQLRAVTGLNLLKEFNQ